MNKKKILWIAILAIFIIAIIAVIMVVKPVESTQSQSLSEKNTEIEDNSDEIIENTESEITIAESEVEENSEKKATIITELEDGILYSYTGEQAEADIVIGDNYYDTQINDIMLYYSKYKDKVIEIEGMYLESLPYTFVGRYSTSNLCAYCPVGYSYIEYVWEGDNIELEVESSWIKVIGTVLVGNDETSYYQDYYYIDVMSIEVMNEKGIDTVNN